MMPSMSAEYVREYRVRRAAEAARGERAVRHGTKGAYVHDGCRCDPCRAANTEATRTLRARRKATS